MAWLERNVEARRDPRRLLEGCETVISFAYPYPSAVPTTTDGFFVSRYTQPRQEDYHGRLRGLCRLCCSMIEERYPGSRTRVCVDSAPVMERSFACASGIGFIGKNNMLIIPGYGSYVFLSEVITTAAMEFPSEEPCRNLCGECSLCVDACPTGALERPFSLDARRCLSYLSIEEKGPVGYEFGLKMGRCFLGCDRCQEACPLNSRESSCEIVLPSTHEILAMDEGAFKERFGTTALARPGLKKLKEDIRAVSGNPVLSCEL